MNCFPRPPTGESLLDDLGAVDERPFGLLGLLQLFDFLAVRRYLLQPLL